MRLKRQRKQPRLYEQTWSLKAFEVSAKPAEKKKEFRKKKKKQEKREIRTQRSRFPQSLQGGGKKREFRKKSGVLSSIETLI